MADVGVIELQIYDNSKEASTGLDALGGALDRIKKSVSGGLKLDEAAQGIENVKNAVASAKADSGFEKVASRIEKAAGKLNDQLKIELKEIKDTVTSGIADGADNIVPGLENVESKTQAMRELMTVYSSTAEAAQALGITEEEVARRAQETYNMLQAKSGGATVFSSAEEASKSLGMTLEEIEAACAKTISMVYGGSGGGAGGGGGGSSGGVFEKIEEESETARTLLDMLIDKIRILQAEVNSGTTEKGTFLSEKAIVNDEIQIAKLTEQVERLRSRMSAGAAVNGADVVSALGDYSNIDLMVMKLDGMKQALAEDINMNRLSTQQIAERMAKINSLTDSIERLRSAQEGASGSAFNLGDAYKGVGKSLKSAFPLLERIRNQLSRIVMRRAIMAVIKSFTSGLKEGVENVYNYSKAIKGSFAPAMDSAVSAIAQMKNSLGAAVAPLLQALIPVFQQIISWVITAINYLNQFFALLRGQSTWIKALPQTVGAFDKQKKAAKGAGAAIKDLLADWDELNIIQSQGGGGGGGATTTAEDYLKMFEELGEFDSRIKKIVSFVKDNMDDVLKVAKNIGIAMLGWKLSNVLTGPLGTLAALVSAGKLIEVTWKLTEMFDNEYVKTGDNGWLVADALTNILGATLAGTIVETVLGGGTGFITAGIEMTVSAGISYGIAYSNEDDDKKKALKKLSMIKAAIGFAALSTGFGIASGSAAVGILSAAALAVPLFTLAAAVSIVVKQYEDATAIAKKAFADTGEGGISVSKIFEALQEEMDKASSGYSLATDAFANAAQLKTDISDAFATITNLSAAVKGEGKLTQDEANAFKQAWSTVFDAFKGLTADSFNTIFTGLNESLRSENETIRNEAKKLRITMLSAKNDISEAMAEFQLEQQGLADKIATGKASKDEIQQYFDNLDLMAQLTKTSTSDFEDAIKQGSKIDFGDADNAVSNAVEFIRNSSEEAQRATEEIEAGREAMLQAADEAWKNIVFAHTRGKIDDDTYKMYEESFNAMRENFKQAAEDNKDKVRTTAENAYRTVIEQALSGIANMEGVVAENGKVDVFKLTAYINEILTPILSAAREAGYNFDEEFGKMFGMGINLQDWIKEAKFDDLINYIKQEILGLDIGGTIENEMDPVDVPVEVDTKLSDNVGKVIRMFKRELKDGMSGEDIQEIIDDAIAMYGEAAYKEALPQLNGAIEGAKASVEVKVSNTREVTDTVADCVQDAVDSVNVADVNIPEVDKRSRELVQSILDAATEGLTPRGMSDQVAKKRFSLGVQEGYSWGDFVEIRDVVDAILADYEEMHKQGYIDTEELNRRYGMYGTGYGMPEEGVSLDTDDVSSGVEKGASRANQAVVAAVNNLLAAINRLNGRPIQVSINAGTGLGRTLARSGQMLEDAGGTFYTIG